jgi:hypothetical protein
LQDSIPFSNFFSLDNKESISVRVDEPPSTLRYEVRFDNIVSDEEEYTVTISTGNRLG